MQNCNNRHLLQNRLNQSVVFAFLQKDGFIRRNSVKIKLVALISSISDGDRTQREPNPICKVLYLQTKKYH